ncbi:LCP family protein [Oceanobacillus iheyensis]|uniref:LCP family glycopolymer transferase n=1 Tax=Oceanobacillus iheyensis TaxID=182710 RepID=UPI00363DF124
MGRDKKNSSLEDYNLFFTKKDREETLKKIKDGTQYKSEVKSKKRFLGPAIGTFVALILSIGLIYVYSQSSVNQSQYDNQAQDTVAQNDNAFSFVLFGSDEAAKNNRSSIIILVTYNSFDNSMKMVPISRDTYATIINSDGEDMGKNKITHATAYSSTYDSALKTVENLMNVPIEYYSAVSEEVFFDELDLTKEEVREDRLMSNLEEVLRERMKINDLIRVLKNSDTNMPEKVISDMNIESLDILDLYSSDVVIDEIYYQKIDSDNLDIISKDLKEHLTKN